MMQSVQRLSRQDDVDRMPVRSAAEIPGLSHREATEMAATETERFLTLVASLAPEEWGRPTACVAWNVRQVVAHVAGEAAAYARFSEFRRQGSGKVQRPYREAGLSKLDAMNQIQVDDRASASPTDLMAELQEVGPRFLATRRRIPAVVRAVRLPLGLAFPLGRTWVPIGYLTDVILTRDTWMHRLDVARATGREMVLTPQHDARMTALVVRDLAASLPERVNGATVVVELRGAAGGAWRIGRDEQTSAVLTMDALDFHLLASGCITVGDMLARSLVSIDGNTGIARRALESTSVPY
ncbi:MAG: maleylpyruvate isomerase family mycothiol-dependent enzyme [Chloroflexi bacterium]|nr:maleylpyruvate isomerase family mycothiol-dependent enzyme [Chloroflexota bacterium]